MVRSFSLSSKQQNSIWRGKEYANLQYKKQSLYLWRVRWSDGGKGLTIFSYLSLSLSTLYDRLNLSLYVLFLPVFSAFYLSLNCILGFYVFGISRSRSQSLCVLGSLAIFLTISIDHWMDKIHIKIIHGNRNWIRILKPKNS